jgi:hypothetical protein
MIIHAVLYDTSTYTMSVFDTVTAGRFSQEQMPKSSLR